MVGDSRRSRKIKNWRNIKKQFDYSRLVESDDKNISNQIKQEKKIVIKKKDMKPKVLIGKGYKRRKLTKKKFANHEMLSGKGYRNKINKKF